jgi:membrane protease YdiL (CAAX protease family)
MPHPLDHLLFAILAVLFPLRAGVLGFRRLKLAAPERLSAVRRSVYRQAMVMQWTLVAVLVALWAWRGRPWTWLGFVPAFHPGLYGVAAGVVVAAFVLLRQQRSAADSAEALSRLRRRMQHLEVMLPHDREELRLFRALAVTAGICEETLYRGFLIWYFGHWVGVLPAAGLAAIVFGLAHAYQGVRGVLTTGAVGAFLGGVYLVSGSLLMPALIHALMDLHAGELMYTAYMERAEAVASS